MNCRTRWSRVLALLVSLVASILVTTPALADDLVPVYRMYNTRTSEHLYTTGKAEYNACGKGAYRDWRAEGIGWYAPPQGWGDPVWRLYNPGLGDHHYTSNAGERNSLVNKHGWRLEGVAFQTADEDWDGAVPLYRLYNGRLKHGQHHYTSNANERDALVARHGWRYEQVGFYGIDPETWDDGDGGDEDGEWLERDELQEMVDDGEIEVIWHADDTPRAIIGPTTDEPICDEQDAADELNRLYEVLGEGYWASPEQIDAQHVTDDSGDGEYFYRYTQAIDGIPVIGSQIVISTDEDGNMTGLLNAHNPRTDWLGFDTLIDEGDAIAVVRQSLASEFGAGFDASQLDLSAYLAIDAIGYEDVPALVWAVRATNLTYADDESYQIDTSQDAGDVDGETTFAGPDASGASAARLAVVDRTYHVLANDDLGGDHEAGEIHRVLDGLKEASILSPVNVWGRDLRGDMRGVSCAWFARTIDRHTLYYDLERDIQVYSLADGTIVWNDDGSQSVNYGLLPGRAVNFGDSYFGALDITLLGDYEEIYDFYLDVLGRRSYDGRGGKIRIGYYVDDWWNACWVPGCGQIIYGDLGAFYQALDVSGHEFTHAVIENVIRTSDENGDFVPAGLSYRGESGALNESYADIMGMLIENKDGDGRWAYAEDSTQTSRSFSNPGAFGDPDHYSKRCTDPEDGNHDWGGVHTNSSIFNHAAYLMMTDARTRSVSRDTWARVFYRSLHYLSVDASFKDARSAVIMSAICRGFTGQRLQAIIDAFDAVGIGRDTTVNSLVSWSSPASPSHADIDLDAYFYAWYDNGEALTVSAIEDTGAGQKGSELVRMHYDKPGTYFFCVHDFDHEYRNWTANVRVYDSDPAEVLASFGPNKTPTPGTWWTIYRMDVDENLAATFTYVNEWSNECPWDEGYVDDDDGGDEPVDDITYKVKATLTWTSAGSNAAADLDGYFYTGSGSSAKVFSHDSNPTPNPRGTTETVTMDLAPGTFYLCAWDQSFNYRFWNATVRVDKLTYRNGSLERTTNIGSYETSYSGASAPNRCWVVCSLSVDDDLNVSISKEDRWRANKT